MKKAYDRRTVSPIRKDDSPKDDSPKDDSQIIKLKKPNDISPEQFAQANIKNALEKITIQKNLEELLKNKDLMIKYVDDIEQEMKDLKNRTVQPKPSNVSSQHIGNTENDLVRKIMKLLREKNVSDANQHLDLLRQNYNGSKSIVNIEYHMSRIKK